MGYNVKTLGKSTLVSGITATQTTATLAAGTGSRFPIANFLVLIYNRTNYFSPVEAVLAGEGAIYEVVSRTADVLTFKDSAGNRLGMEGTTAIAHNTAGKSYGVLNIAGESLFSSLSHKDAANTFTVGQIFNEGITVANNKSVAGKSTGGVDKNLVKIDTSNRVQIGQSDTEVVFKNGNNSDGLIWSPSGGGNAGVVDFFGSEIGLWGGKLSSINNGLNLNGSAVINGKFVKLYASSGVTPDLTVNDGKVGIATTTPIISGTGKLHIVGNTFRSFDATRTPPTSGDAGNIGDICFDASYLYICTALNTWKRIALVAF